MSSSADLKHAEQFPDPAARPGAVTGTPEPPPEPVATVPTQVRERAPRTGVDVVPLAVVIDLVALVVATRVTSLSIVSSVLLLLLILCFNAAGGHYRPRLAPSLLDEIPSLVGRALVAGAVVTAFRILLELPVQAGPVTVAVLFLVLACLGRAVGYPLVRRSRVVGRVARPTIIVGCGRVGDQLAQTLLEHPEYGLKPVGFVDDSPFIPTADLRVPLLGGTDSLAGLLRRHDVSNVIVAFSSSRESVIVDVLRTCDRLRCEIFLVPRFYELHGTARDNELVWGLPLIRLRRAPYRTLTWRCKRGADAVLALLGLVLLSPVLAACALAVRLEGGPGVIFRQERVGLDGRPFTMLKFRSLKPTDELESTSNWNIGGDPRIGRVGRILRQTSLDELPQLWNVVRGDMSLVGPRPERPFFVQEFTKQFPRYMARHRVPAGMTGWAQINGLRGDTDISERARFDNYYIENWSLWEDVKIVLRTTGQVLGGRGA
ncbi:MAG: exopolysaccharide biosynthesis polyprenyl glycosylphosphotransferase [Nocardioidaceae bacterium]|jgi:exopolysaccharide biosynthesis polyprenyl glycosylphosphotransferase|nr:exopolysaccharide biosynthesis polyprenyl glycosylphosphotransferase [Nocardioidaceae bacterium]